MYLYKYNFSVSENLSAVRENIHSKELIYETNIINILNDFKEFLTIFNSSFDYNFNFSHSFNFNAIFDDNLVIPECISTVYTELIIVLVKLKNGFFDNFDYQNLWETVALMVCLTHLISVDKFIGYL